MKNYLIKDLALTKYIKLLWEDLKYMMRAK